MARQITRRQARHGYGLIEGALIPEPFDRFEQVRKPDGTHYVIVTHLDGSQERFTSNDEGRLVRMEDRMYRVRRSDGRAEKV